MNYFKKVWINKYNKIFNYSFIIEDIMKIKNQYTNNKGKNNSEYNLISHLKSLDNVYFTNRIYKSIQKFLIICLNMPITKACFGDTINFILNEYNYIIPNIKRRRSLIIIVLKYNLNNKPKFKDFNTFKNEIEKTISIMTGNINSNFTKELFNDMDEIEIDTDIDIETNSEYSIKDNNISINSDENS